MKLALTLYILGYCLLWLFRPIHAVENPYCIVGEIPGTWAAIRNNGPYHQYKITPDGRLYTRREGTGWLRLPY